MSPSPDQFRLDGQAALVTGGGSGIGRAIAEALAQAGSRVVIVGRRKEVLHQVAGAMGAHAIVGDIAELESLPGLIRRARDMAGPLSILVHAAGNHLKTDALATSNTEFGRILRTHLLAGFALAREVAPDMMARGTGSIVFIGSMATVMGVPKVSAYTAAKAAITSLAPQLSSEWACHGVRVNTVTPGWIETDMTTQAFANDPNRLQKVLHRTPMSRLGTPGDVANAVVYLCSPAGRFITGINLPVDGGAGRGF